LDGAQAVYGAATLRKRSERAMHAPPPCRAPGPLGRFDAARPTADQGRRNIQPQSFELVTPAAPFPKGFSREVIKDPNLDPFKHAKAVGIDFARFSPHALRATAATNALTGEPTWARCRNGWDTRTCRPRASTTVAAPARGQPHLPRSVLELRDLWQRQSISLPPSAKAKKRKRFGNNRQGNRVNFPYVRASMVSALSPAVS